jgi:hypothetical protein
MPKTREAVGIKMRGRLWPKLTPKRISLLFTGMFLCLGAGSAFGANAELSNVSAISAGVNASGPSAAATEEEDGPSQKAAARPGAPLPKPDRRCLLSYELPEVFTIPRLTWPR